MCVWVWVCVWVCMCVCVGVCEWKLEKFSKCQNRDISRPETMLHFKGLVTISGHLSDKIFIASHFIKNTKSYLSNIANRLYFQKIVGFPIVGTLEMGFSDAFVSKNTSKSPISHDKIPCPTSHNDIFCLNDGHLGVILDLLPLHIPRRT